jgi:hypothetical protein
MKTTKEERDKLRRRAESVAAKPVGHGMMWGSAHYILRLIDDADRCEEFEAMLTEMDESLEAVIHRGGCAYCDWLGTPVPTMEPVAKASRSPCQRL